MTLRHPRVGSSARMRSNSHAPTTTSGTKTGATGRVPICAETFVAPEKGRRPHQGYEVHNGQAG